ncbi:MAG: preprotein translocase subunit YajC [Dysgonamonadaceae bacterium]|jgi:preprotein translocase subunit YajC|nr:preprotein translocase subunit YajC [Dysgonamonadaceae bacterium]MDD3357192.1 preprotein translocase subunit YajC [Dysgonamonadaceae bacterium]MDD3728103.1 preprotein translocase subunit YajC [Dysgonamonadaceae bacterium]MDD4247097.1 preprotein translocase subunit YajC [Dysgonamonadaceae bacterium]MDD4606037.1 preprotein translocase subunit YajC [Dysgonamonadaceae bacterium]
MNILLQAGGPMGSSLIFMVAIIAIFYFFMIRPQQKKQKQIQKAREAMQIGDRVITSGGIHGRIREIHDAYFILEVSRDVTIKVDKASVFASATDVGN